MVYTVAIKLGPRGCKIFHYTGCDYKYLAVNVKASLTCLSILDRNEILIPLRSLGRSFDDPVVKRDMNSWPNQVINLKNRPMFQVGQKYDSTTTFHSAEEIVSWMLEAGKCKIEEKAGDDSYSAILIVPNDFNETQQESMRAAIKLSKIQVTKIINQATAVGYSLNAVRSQINLNDENENIYDDLPIPPTPSPLPDSGLYLFFHLGSYSLDITVISYDKENELIEVVSKVGDSRLGSIDFTRRMDSAVKEFCKEQNLTCERNWIPWKFHLNLSEKDEIRLIPLQYKDMSHQWKRESLEEMILHLTESLKHDFDPHHLKRRLNKKKRKLKQLGPINSSRCYQLTRAKFEQECCDLFDRVAQQVEKAVEEAGKDRSGYRQIKLYGGGAISWPTITDLISRILPNISVDYDKVPEDLDSPDLWSFLSSFGQASYDLLGAACLAHVLENNTQEKIHPQNNSSHIEQLCNTTTPHFGRAQLIDSTMKRPHNLTT